MSPIISFHVHPLMNLHKNIVAAAFYIAEMKTKGSSTPIEIEYALVVDSRVNLCMCV